MMKSKKGVLSSAVLSVTGTKGKCFNLRNGVSEPSASIDLGLNGDQRLKVEC